MKFSTAQVVQTLAILSNAGQSLAQTPPGFSIATNNTLTAMFGNTSISNGNTIPIPNTAASPAITLPSASTKGNSSHVVFMLDLDAPNASPLLHWLIALPAGTSKLSSNDTSAALNDVAPYIGPAPPPGTGKHRYVLLLFSNPSASFQLPSAYADFDPSVITDRILFDIQGVVTDEKLTLLAANWFTAENTTSTASTTASKTAAGAASSTASKTTAGAASSTATQAVVTAGAGIKIDAAKYAVAGLSSLLAVWLAYI
ncbi:phosphatidylethanolamine-binding protein [Xylariales sp. PMI_506]|nr:phosphatidylethanolamine-binding protein [Xylariales sp. PMI_506]